MKNTKANLITKLLIMIIIAIVGFNFSVSRLYAEEDIPAQTDSEETSTEELILEENQTEVVIEATEAPSQPNTEGLSVAEANELIEEYNSQVDEYNEAKQLEFEQEVAAAEEHNAAEDAKVAENEKLIQAYENAQAKIEAHENSGPATKTTDVNELPDSYEVTLEDPNEAKTIIYTEAEEKSGEKVKVMNIHFFFDEDCTYDGYMPYDLEDLLNNEDIRSHTVLAEWETIEIDKNDTIQTISEADTMKSGNSSFYKYLDGYVNGFWYPSLSMFSSTAVNSNYEWFKGSSQIASYDQGTTDRRAPVDMFSMYTYNFYRRGPEAAYTEKYEADYMEVPTEAAKLEKMELLSEPEKEEIVPVIDEKEPAPVEEEIIEVVIPETVTPQAEPEVEEAVEIAEEETPAAAPVETVTVATIIAEAAAPAAAPEVKEEIEVEAALPQIEETIEINDETAPLAGSDEIAVEINHWALVNLLSVIVTALTALGMIVTFFRNNKEEENEDELNKAQIVETEANEEEEDEESRRRSKFLGLIPAIVSIIFFILTEDMRNPMTLIDRYTLLMIIIAITNIVLAIITRNKKEKDNEYEQQFQTEAA